jgi:hypothetical protein
MAGGLITSLMLKEDYVVHVLGFEKSLLNEGRYNVALQQEILEAHLLAEGWFESGLKWLKDKGVEGFEAVKDKALEVPNAIKKFGSDVKGIVAALTAMVHDPEEARAYQNGIFGNIRLWPKRVIKNLAAIRKWLEDHNMPTFANGVGKIIEALKSAFQMAKSASGWLGSISMLAFGLATKYIEEEFGIKEKTATAVQYMKDPKSMLGDLAKAGMESSEEVLDDVKEFFQGKITDVVENTELFDKIKEFLKEKLGFLEIIKEKFIDFTKKVAGKAVEAFAGPIGWIKTLVQLFQDSSWVISNLSGMLVRASILG